MFQLIWVERHSISVFLRSLLGCQHDAKFREFLQGVKKPGSISYLLSMVTPDNPKCTLSKPTLLLKQCENHPLAKKTHIDFINGLLLRRKCWINQCIGNVCLMPQFGFVNTYYALEFLNKYFRLQKNGLDMNSTFRNLYLSYSNMKEESCQEKSRGKKWSM